ncbi:MAG: TIGR01212 family radical SAM protein, partial [Planctomycetota bacterium]|nr:TIGR01212 family radical SAM protein [Planctomycetota bacterium]
DSLEQIKRWAPVAPILAVGTRPDCFSEEAADLLALQAKHFDEVWVEFGLETADDKVQEIIGRHDTLANFHGACGLAGERGLQRIAHCIAGLPGEKEGGLMRQVEEVAKAQCEGIKFHQMMVLHKTKLANMWMNGGIDLLSAEQYTTMVADAVEILPPQVVVHRLVAEAPADSYLAPKPWPGRAKVHSCIEQELQRRGSHQGSRLT